MILEGFRGFREITRSFWKPQHVLYGFHDVSGTSGEFPRVLEGFQRASGDFQGVIRAFKALRCISGDPRGFRELQGGFPRVYWLILEISGGVRVVSMCF